MRQMITIVSLVAATVCGAAPPLIPEEKPPRHLIVFYDISRSVAEDEEKAGEDDLTQLFDRVPGGTELVFIPICANTDGAPQTSWTVEPLEGITPRHKQEDAIKRNRKKAEVLAKMRALRATAAARSRYSSCVSPALRRVESFVSTPEEASLTDVLFISDMIEECEDSLLSNPTSMLDEHFRGALALVEEKSTLLELPRGLHVYVFRPHAVTTAAGKPHHPPAGQLEQFWRKLFDRCGIHQLRWNFDIDRYLKTLVPR